MSWLEEDAAEALGTWRARGLMRSPATFGSGPAPVATIGGEELVLFSSSDYLGLAQDQRLVDAAREATARWGVGTGGSRLTTGTTAVHREAERAFADFLGYPEAVLFSSGFAANTGLLQALAGPQTLILSDELNHASLIDGCRLATLRGARVEVYPHADVAAVERILAENPEFRCLVVTDGVFSMDGTLALVPELSAACRAHPSAALVVDDAHGTGTVGATGRGVSEHFDMEGDSPTVLVATASKALGAEGAVVACSPVVAELLRQKARPYVFSTSPSAATCAAITRALEVIRGEGSPVPRLRRNVRRLTEALGWKDWETPIVPVPIGDEAAAVTCSAALREQGFFVPAIRWPTVPRGRAILRVTVMATHTDRQIDALAEVLRGGGSGRSWRS